MIFFFLNSFNSLHLCSLLALGAQRLRSDSSWPFFITKIGFRCPFCAESFKFLYSLGAMARRGELSMWRGITWRSNLPYLVPALLFAVDNNSVFIILQYIDNATFAISSQIKIIFTSGLVAVSFFLLSVSRLAHNIFSSFSSLLSTIVFWHPKNCSFASFCGCSGCQVASFHVYSGDFVARACDVESRFSDWVRYTDLTNCYMWRSFELMCGDEEKFDPFSNFLWIC